MLFARAKAERLASAVRDNDNELVSLTVLSFLCSTSNILNKLMI
jgi:hypothetical protein